jgi:hypothetical protein
MGGTCHSKTAPRGEPARSSKRPLWCAARAALIAEGMTNRQIGEQLFLAEKTVKNYVSNLLAKRA